MRSNLILAVLAVMLVAALATGATPTVTTMITIPLGAIAGFRMAVATIEAVERRRDASRRMRRAARHAAATSAMGKVVVLHPMSREPAPKQRLLIAA